jgi:hypothetical protein
MAKLNKKIRIQKLGVFMIILIAENFGASPKKLPPLPKRANAIPTAFPQSLGLTIDVTVVIPDGRYVPAEIPKRKKQHLTAKRLLLKEMAESAVPMAMAEKTMVFLWLIREDMCPDPKSDMKYPIERKKNKKPASP